MHLPEISTVPSGGVSSPSLPLEDVQGAEEEYVFLLMECLRATIEGKQRGREGEREREREVCMWRGWGGGGGEGVDTQREKVRKNTIFSLLCQECVYCPLDHMP